MVLSALEMRSYITLSTRQENYDFLSSSHFQGNNDVLVHLVNFANFQCFCQSLCMYIYVYVYV